MNREQILKAAQRKLERHTLSTFNETAPNAPTGIIAIPGCPVCGVRLNTIEQFVRHLSDDVLPGIVDLVIGGGREPGREPM